MPVGKGHDTLVLTSFSRAVFNAKLQVRRTQRNPVDTFPPGGARTTFARPTPAKTKTKAVPSFDSFGSAEGPRRSPTRCAFLVHAGDMYTLSRFVLRAERETFTLGHVPGPTPSCFCCCFFFACVGLVPLFWYSCFSSSSFFVLLRSLSFSFKRTRWATYISRCRVRKGWTGRLAPRKEGRKEGERTLSNGEMCPFSPRSLFIQFPTSSHAKALRGETAHIERLIRKGGGVRRVLTNSRTGKL